MLDLLLFIFKQEVLDRSRLVSLHEFPVRLLGLNFLEKWSQVIGQVVTGVDRKVTQELSHLLRLQLILAITAASLTIEPGCLHR